jgi:hypothetical protein
VDTDYWRWNWLAAVQKRIEADPIGQVSRVVDQASFAVADEISLVHGWRSLVAGQTGFERLVRQGVGQKGGRYEALV